jgi:hypothetical protein
MEGALDEIIQALITHDQAEKLNNEALASITPDADSRSRQPTSPAPN